MVDVSSLAGGEAATAVLAISARLISGPPLTDAGMHPIPGRREIDEDGTRPLLGFTCFLLAPFRSDRTSLLLFIIKFANT